MSLIDYTEIQNPKERIIQLKNLYNMTISLSKTLGCTFNEQKRKQEILKRAEKYRVELEEEKEKYPEYFL